MLLPYVNCAVLRCGKEAAPVQRLVVWKACVNNRCGHCEAPSSCDLRVPTQHALVNRGPPAAAICSALAGPVHSEAGIGALLTDAQSFAQLFASAVGWWPRDQPVSCHGSCHATAIHSRLLRNSTWQGALSQQLLLVASSLPGNDMQKPAAQV